MHKPTRASMRWLTDKSTIMQNILDRVPFRSRYITGRWIGSFYPKNKHGAYVLTLTPKRKSEARPKPLLRYLPKFPRFKGMIEAPPDPLILYVYVAARSLWYGNVDLLPPSMSKRGRGTSPRMAAALEPRVVEGKGGTGVAIKLVRSRLRPSEILLSFMPRVPELIGRRETGAAFNSPKHWRIEHNLKNLIEKSYKERIDSKRPKPKEKLILIPTELPNKPLPLPDHIKNLQNIFKPDPAV